MFIGWSWAASHPLFLKLHFLPEVQMELMLSAQEMWLYSDISWSWYLRSPLCIIRAKWRYSSGVSKLTKSMQRSLRMSTIATKPIMFVCFLSSLWWQRKSSLNFIPLITQSWPTLSWAWTWALWKGLLSFPWIIFPTSDSFVFVPKVFRSELTPVCDRGSSWGRQLLHLALHNVGW